MVDGPILLIDDEPSVLDVMRAHLAELGHECTGETSPLRALELLRFQSFSLMITDLNMPEMNGIEMVRRAKEMDPDLAIVVVTGMVDINSAIEAMHSGADDYVVKPFNLREVGLAASRALEKRQLVIQNRRYQENLELRVQEATEHLEAVNSELRETKQYLESLLHSTLDAIITSNATDHITFINEGALHMLGFSPKELVGSDVAQLYVGGPDEMGYLRRKLHEEGRLQNYETELKRKDGTSLPVIVSLSSVSKPDGSLHSILAICKDVTLQKQLEKELKEMSIKDSLTGMYNMRYFYDRIPIEIERARRQSHALSLLLFDVDQFKRYNDTKGHLEGDRVLQAVGHAVVECTREHVDLGFRYGGDEFTILLPETDGEQATRVADRIRASLARRTEDHLTLSIGVAEYREGTSVKSFIQLADSMMYESKRSGGNKVSLYKPEAHSVA
ncbi:MAG: diguanylate cyclase [Candidatus Hydrogenedentes bacterium]|nr:diguanylate cyclase [Candidatus Hydrogenedentota bacterium]